MVGTGMRTDRPPPFLTHLRFWLPQDTARYGNLLTLRNFIFEMGRYNDVAFGRNSETTTIESAVYVFLIFHPDVRETKISLTMFFPKKKTK